MVPFDARRAVLHRKTAECLGFGGTMRQDDDLRVRLGRIRHRGDGRDTKRFVTRVLAAAEKAGAGFRSGRHHGRAAGFGRGRVATWRAARLLSDRARRVVVKARVVRHGRKAAPLAAHLAYLRREGVTKDGEPARLFGADTDAADHRAFAERCHDDRHHFRFTVAPEDAGDLADLKAFTRDLMADMSRDLGTRLDWVAVDHWNTGHPHVHVIVRGKADDGRDLVIARDYISRGMRSRAEHLVSLELGPRSDRQIRSALQGEVEAERWTSLDRALAAEAAAHERVVDLRPQRNMNPADESRTLLIARMDKLERLGLARPLGPAQWMLAEEAEPTLRDLAIRGDIVKRIHRGLGTINVERGVSDFVLESVGGASPVIGRLVGKGLDDELTGSAYAVVDGIDGRVHHVRIADPEALNDAVVGGIVEVRRLDSGNGRREQLAAFVRSDLPVAAQARADGATWLDRQLVAREPAVLGQGGFGAEVRVALDQRAEHLIGEGLARRQGQRVVFARDLLSTLRRRELGAIAGEMVRETGRSYRPSSAGETVRGVYRRRLDLASGRFAMIDDGLGFSLVPWTPSLERHLGRQVTGVVQAVGVDWRMGRSRGPGIG